MPVFRNLSRQVHHRAARVQHRRINRGPGLRAEIQHLGRDRQLVGSRVKHAPVGQHEHVRVDGQAQSRVRQLSPAVGRRVVDLRDSGIAAVTVDRSRGDQHPAIRQRGDGRIPASKRHGGRGRPGQGCRVKYRPVGDAVIIGHVVAAGDEHSPIRQQAMSGAEQIGTAERSRREAVGGRIPDRGQGSIDGGIVAIGQHFAGRHEGDMNRQNRPKSNRTPLTHH